MAHKSLFQSVIIFIFLNREKYIHVSAQQCSFFFMSSWKILLKTTLTYLEYSNSFGKSVELSYFSVGIGTCSDNNHT